MEQCEFCGRKVKRVEGTSFAGCYCIECHRLNRAESLAAIKRIQGKPITKSKKTLRQEVKEQELEELLRQDKGEGQVFDTSYLFKPT